MSTTGMPLRDYRIHRYVNAFCPRCHEEDPERPLEQVERLSGWLAVRTGSAAFSPSCPVRLLLAVLPLLVARIAVQARRGSYSVRLPAVAR